jgi:predicted acylesterase/phospholipase RssA
MGRRLLSFRQLLARHSLRRLCRKGDRIEPDFVVGTSAGAINVAYFSQTPTLAGVDNLAKVWQGMKRVGVRSSPTAFRALRNGSIAEKMLGRPGRNETNVAHDHFGSSWHTTE